MGFTLPSFNLPGVMNLDGLSMDILKSSGPGVIKNVYPFVLWDTARITNNVLIPSTTIRLFQVQNGGNTNTIGGGVQYQKNLCDTNLVQAGQLPRGRVMVVNQIEVQITLTGNAPLTSTTGNNNLLPTTQGFSANTTSAFSDLRSFLQQGYGKIKIGTRDYSEGLLYDFPPSVGMSGFGFGIGATTGQTINIDSYAQNGFGLAWSYPDNPYYLVAGDNFEYDIVFPNSFTVQANSPVNLITRFKGVLLDPVA